MAPGGACRRPGRGAAGGGGGGGTHDSWYQYGGSGNGAGAFSSETEWIPGVKYGWEIQPTNDGLMIWLLISVMVHYCVPKHQNNCESLEMMPWYTIVSPGFLG